VVLAPMDRLLAAEATDETDVDLCLIVFRPATDFGGSGGLVAVLGSALAARFWALIAAALLLTVEPTAGRTAGIVLAGKVDVFGATEVCDVAEGCRLRILAKVD